jgi:hypothetical protein
MSSDNTENISDLTCESMFELQQEIFHLHHFEVDPPFVYFPYDQPTVIIEHTGCLVDGDKSDVAPANRDCWEDIDPARHGNQPDVRLGATSGSTILQRPSRRTRKTSYERHRGERCNEESSTSIRWISPICREPIGLTKLLSRCEGDMELLVEVRSLHKFFF